MTVEQSSAGFIIPDAPQIGAREQDVLGLEPGLYPGDVQQRPDEQAGADQENDRYRNLPGDQDILQQSVVVPSRRCCALECRYKIGLLAVERRRQSKDYGC